MPEIRSTIRVALADDDIFRLSDEAILLCVERGMTLAPPLPEGEYRLTPGFDFFTWGARLSQDTGQLYGTMGCGFDRGFRTNPIVLGVLEELGGRAIHTEDGKPGKFKVVEIPFGSIDGWDIRDYETRTGEYIVENHRTWE